MSTKIFRIRFLVVPVVVLSLLSFLPAVFADPAVPTMTAYIVGSEGGMITYAPAYEDFQVSEDGYMLELASPVSYEGIWGGSADWTIQELKYEVDPIVYNNILLQNNSAVVQSYVVTVNLPTTWPAPNQIRGSIDTSVIGTDSLVSAPLDGAIYSALIDGVTVQTLQDAPFSLGTSQSATSDFVDFGFDPSGIPVNASIGIKLTFSLSPGDTVAILSDFEVVPEPGSLAMLLVGASVMAWRRRRNP